MFILLPPIFLLMVPKVLYFFPSFSLSIFFLFITKNFKFESFPKNIFLSCLLLKHFSIWLFFETRGDWPTLRISNSVLVLSLRGHWTYICFSTDTLYFAMAYLLFFDIFKLISSTATNPSLELRPEILLPNQLLNFPKFLDLFEGIGEFMLSLCIRPLKVLGIFFHHTSSIKSWLKG